MRPLDDATSLPPEERLQAIAAVLAAGLRRLRRPASPAAPAPEKPPKSVADYLELPGETRLSVHTG